MGTVKYNEKRKYWEVRYDAARHGDGERNQKYKGGFARKRDAEAFLAEQETNINRGVYIDPKKTFVFEYLADWLKDKKDTISPTTYSGYEINIRCHINPYVGGLRLQELKPPHIRNLYQQLKKDRKIKIGGKARQFKKLSNTSIQYIHRVLSKALEDAYREEIITKNPAKLVTPPTPDRFEAGFLTVSQIKKMLDCFENDDMLLPVMLAVALGLRRGEALGLQWTDIDFKNKVIRIRHNYIIDEGKPKLQEKPKTDSSRRDIVITDTFIKVLKRHKANQRAARIRLGSLYHKSNFVCTWPDGKPFSPSHVSRNFTKRMTKYKLPAIRFHDLRHSNAALMISQNIPMKGASDRLGHSTIQITSDLYGHVERSVQEDIARKIDSAIWGD